MNIIGLTTVMILLIFSCLLCQRLSHARRVNLAYGKPTFQTSTHSGGESPHAVDGNTNHDFFQGSCTHTTGWDPIAAWWMVDLQQEYTIGSVEISNRGDQWYRLRDFIVEISKQDPRPLPGFPGSTSSPICARQKNVVGWGATMFYPCLTIARGRYVRVVKYDTSPLSLCEVKVFEASFRSLAKASSASGIQDIIETIPGISAITECVLVCSFYRGIPCKHIQFHSVNKMCRLLSYFKSGPQPNSGWELFNIND